MERFHLSSFRAIFLICKDFYPLFNFVLNSSAQKRLVCAEFSTENLFGVKTSLSIFDVWFLGPWTRTTVPCLVIFYTAAQREIEAILLCRWNLVLLTPWYHLDYKGNNANNNADSHKRVEGKASISSSETAHFANNKNSPMALHFIHYSLSIRPRTSAVLVRSARFPWMCSIEGCSWNKTKPITPLPILLIVNSWRRCIQKHFNSQHLLIMDIWPSLSPSLSPWFITVSPPYHLTSLSPRSKCTNTVVTSNTS